MSLEYALYLTEVLNETSAYHQFPQFHDNKRFVISCIKYNYEPKEIHENLKQYENVMFQLMKFRFYRHIKEFSSEDPIKFRNFHLRILQENINLFSQFPENLKDDKEITLAAIRLSQNRGVNIKYASESLKKNEVIMMEAFTLNLENSTYDTYFNHFITEK
jgi:hypothetical protein